MAIQTISIFTFYQSSVDGLTASATFSDEFFLSNNDQNIAFILRGANPPTGTNNQVILGATAFDDPDNTTITITGPAHALEYAISDFSLSAGVYTYDVPEDEQAHFNAFIDHLQARRNARLFFTVADTPLLLAFPKAGEPTVHFNPLNTLQPFEGVFYTSSVRAAATWVNIGKNATSDDIPLPDDILVSGMASLDFIQSSNAAVRIRFDSGVGRFTPEFEEKGTLILRDDSTGIDIVQLQDLGGYWSPNTNRYTVNSDDAFSVGSRTSLRNWIETAGNNAAVRVLFVRPKPPISALPRAGSPDVSVNLLSPINVEILATAGSPYVEANVQAHHDLRIRTSAGVPDTSLNVEKHTALTATSARAGLPSASVGLSAPAISFGASAGTPDTSVSAGPTKQFDFTLPITKSGSTFRWADVGLSTGGDDIAVPDAITDTDNSAIDYLQFRDNGEVRIHFTDSSGPLSNEFEDEGILYILDETNRTVLLALQGISSYWRPSIFQYRINNDDAVIFGSRTTLRTHIDTIGNGAELRFLFLAPSVDLKIAAQAGAPAASMHLLGPELALAASAGTPDIRANVEAHHDIRIRARTGQPAAQVNAKDTINLSAEASAGTPDTQVNVQKQTALSIEVEGDDATARVRLTAPKLAVRQAAGSPTASAHLVGPALALSASAGSPDVNFDLPRPSLTFRPRAGVPDAQVNVQKQTDLRTRVTAGQPGVDTRIVGPTLSIQFGAGTPRTNVNVEGGKNLSVRFNAGQPVAGIRLIQPDLSTSAIAGVPDANVHLLGHNLSIATSAGTPSIQARLIQPDLSAQATAGLPDTAVNVKNGVDIAVQVEADPPRASFNVEDQKGLKIQRATGVPVTSVHLTGPNLSIFARSDNPGTSIYLIEPTLKFGATAGTPDVSTRVVGPLLSISQAAGSPEVEVGLRHGDLAIDVMADDATGRVNVASGTSIQALARAGVPDANVRVTQPGVEIDRAAGSPEVGTRLESGRVKVGVTAGQPTAMATLFFDGHIQVEADAGVPSALANLNRYTDLRVSLSAGTADGSVHLTIGDLALSVSAGVPDAYAFLPIPDRPRDPVREAGAEGQAESVIYYTSVTGVVTHVDID